jgi:carbonic anhydrase/acetyltransferase-like protein (isoleucine patch superfamily)
VTLGDRASVFYGAVLRGDIARIRVGQGTNLQDKVIVHLADDLDAIIGDWVTVGHGAIVHACTIGDECLIGMGAVILDGAVIGARSLIAAADLVVSAGGTMNREAVVLGTPVWTTFSGSLGAVDRRLIEQGRLRRLVRAEQIEIVPRAAAPAAGAPTLRDPALLVDLALSGLVA